MEIIKAGNRQLADAALLFDQYRQFYRQISDLAGAKAFLADRLAQDDSAIFIAYLDGVPAGFVQLYPLFSSVAMQRTWCLNDLFVTKSCTRRGVASALMDAARRWGEHTGAKSLVLATARDNQPAQSLYQGLGWVRDEVFDHYRLPLTANP